MNFKSLLGPLLGILFLLCGCASTSGADNNTILPISKILKKKDVVTVSYERSEEGLFIIPIGTEFGSYSFLIDTGATRSALFKGEAQELIEAATLSGMARIHGLVNSGTHPIVKIAELRLGRKSFEDLPVAILPERVDNLPSFQTPPAGLIGMDIMANFNIYVDASTNTISFIPVKYAQASFPINWTPVTLYHNPKEVFDRDLHFFDVRVGNHLIPAILDSGAEFNVINWEASIIPSLKRLKRKLKQEWEIQGAIGEFDPAVRISVKGMRAGRKSWKNNEFIVMNFDHMDPLGYKNEPLVIAGSDIFGDSSFYINFVSNKMWLEEQIELGDLRIGENTERIVFDAR